MSKGINSRDVQLELANDAGKLHPWPETVKLGPDVSPLEIYRQAQQQRAHSSWSPLDLIELARTSKMIAFVDDEWEKFQQEGALVPGGKDGTRMVENCRGRTIATINSTISASLRRLGLGANSISQSEKKTEADKAAVQREIRATHKGNEPDDISLI
ncbi:hypothetical protein OAN15_01375 [bacterium]|nr:hypothetical protein [bacterium]